jgi:hypothetical protein
MASLRSAIDAMCRSCIYDPGSGNGGRREQVSACGSSNCPLHAVRPRSAAKSAQPAAKPASGGLRPLPTDAKEEIASKVGQIADVA